VRNTKNKNDIRRKQIKNLIKEHVKEIKVTSRKFNSALRTAKHYEARLIEGGAPQAIINEGVMDIIGGAFNSDAVIDTVKKYIIEGVLNFLGIDGSEHEVLYVLFENILEAIDYTEFMKYFGDNQCEEMMKVVTEASIETVTELGADKILSSLLGNMGGGESGRIVSAISDALGTVAQESLNEVVVSIIQGYLQEPLRELICDTSLTDVLSNIGKSVPGLSSLTGDGGVGDFLGGDLGFLGSLFDGE